MEKTLKKFIDYLDEYREKNVYDVMRKIILKNGNAVLYDSKKEGIIIDGSLVSNEDKEKTRAAKRLETEIEYLKIHIITTKSLSFGDFDLLSKYLIDSKFNIKECFEIILQYIKLNIDAKEYSIKHYSDLELSEYIIFDFDKIDKLSNIDQERLDKFKEYIGISDVVLSKDEKQKKYYILNKIRALCVDNVNELLSCFDSFKAHYFDKKTLYDEDDIHVIIDILNTLGVDESIVRGIEALLLKELDKRNKTKNVIKTKIVAKQQSEINLSLMSDKEYKMLKKELATYFDFRNVEKIRELNNKEILHCIELLIKIDIPFIEIQRFIGMFKKTQEEQIEEYQNTLITKNPISLYIELYNKLKFYEEKYNLTENLEYIKSCLEEMFICSDEEYEFFRNEIESELRKMVVLLPQTYEYEIKETEKRIKFEI